MSSKFDVDVTDPRTDGPRFNTFVTYNLQSTWNTAGVRRRYSDFEWLREVLKYRFHGLAIPMLPEKKLIGNKGAEFVEERMRGLCSFMINLVQNPYLRNDHTVKLFMTVEDTGAGEWEQSKKAVGGGEGAHPSANPGLNRWFGVLRQLSLPSEADTACASLLGHISEIETSIGAFLATVAKYSTLAAEMATVVTDMHRTIGVVETTSTDTLASLPSFLVETREQAGAFSSIAAKLGSAMGSLEDVVKFNTNEINVFLVDPLAKELTRIGALKELLSTREAAAKDHQAAFVRQDKIETEKQGWIAKGKPDKAEKLEPQLAAAQQAVKACRERMDDVTKGLIHVEARRLGTVRNEKFTKILGQYAALCMASLTKNYQSWVTFLSQMGLEENDMVAAARDTLSTSSADDSTPVYFVVTPSAASMAAPVAGAFGGLSAGAGAGHGPLSAAAQEVDL